MQPQTTPDSVSYLLDYTDEPKLQTNQGTALAQHEARLSGVERGADDIAPLPGLRRQRPRDRRKIETAVSENGELCNMRQCSVGWIS